MHDLRWIRDNPAEFDRGLERRGLPPRAEDILALDREWRALETEAQESQALRNRLSRDIGVLKKRGEAADELIRQIDLHKDVEAATAARAAELRRQIDDMLAILPNLPADDVPVGADEHANVEVKRHGAPPQFNFAPLPHEVIGERLGLMDFRTAARLSGARFVVLKGALARLERAIAQFMLDLHTQEFGYLEVAPPFLVRTETVFGTGQYPKAAEDMFRTTEESGGYWLIPTAEVPLTNLVGGEILDEARLPLRFVAWTPCFRSEAGAAGRDTRGMIRQHQFPKVELVSVTRPEDSAAEHERMTGCAEAVLQRLGLAYRVVLLSTGDMGFSARKTYDLEVWLPGQGTYREISSCSNCGPFQARRMRARYRPTGRRQAPEPHSRQEGILQVGGPAAKPSAGVQARTEVATFIGSPQPVHTLNGSGLAVGRTMIAILENFQRHDGTVAIPEALLPYMGGQKLIGTGHG